MADNKVNLKEVLTVGWWKENPVIFMFLGMCPVLGVTTSLTNAVGMTGAVIAVLMITNFLISLIRNICPSEVRIPVYITIIATVVTIIQMLMEAYLPELYNAMRVFIPLIVVNCIILGRAESFASSNGPIASIVDGLGMGLGFGFGLTAMAFVRELLGNGTLFGVRVLPEAFSIGGFVAPVGAFLTLGILAGSAMVIINRANDKKEAAEKERIEELKRIAAEKKAAKEAAAAVESGATA